ncbi:MAG: hypothetical protein WC867_00960 [Candidatus Pacearchaeota archaeon]|jgi:hypothetical protein
MVEIPIINIEVPKPENLVWGENYSEKKDKNKIYKILAYLAVIAALIIFFRFALLAYLYIANLPKINSYDANIERIALTDDGKQAFIKLTGGNQKEIESIKFIFRTNESEYIYETKDGIKEITYEDKRLLSYFAHPEYEGSYDYTIKALDVGLDSFKRIIKVEVLIKYKDEKSGEIKETKIVDSTKKSDINVVRSGGYGGGGGGSGGSGGSGGTSGNEPITTCNPTKTCLNYANLCGSRMSDGCNNILDCSANCKSGEKCLSGSCVSNEIELPETFEVPYILPAGGKTWYINDSGNINTNGVNFQNALVNASLGDVIVLQAGVTYYGNFRLPNKTGNGWLYIISSELGNLQEGNRVDSKDSIHMPKISAYPDGTNCYTAMINEWGAHNYRFSGIEFVTDGCVYNLILLGYHYFRLNEPIWNITGPGHVADTIEKLPYNITFDRCYLHSTNESAKSRTGIMLDGRYMAVIDSYLSNFKDRSDSQAINVYSGPGPYKIVNNYLESTGENFMSGGTDPNILNSVPSDFEIIGNYFYKPDKWNSNSPEYKNISWCIKNLFELKNAQRLIVSGNIFENNWGICGGQRATAIVITPRNQNGMANWSVVQDLIFTNNIIRNFGYAMRVLSNDDLHKSEITKRIEINNNIFDVINHNYYTGYGIGFSSPYNNTPSYNVVVKNNIFLHNYTGGSFMYVGFDPLKITHYSVLDNFTYENNIATHANYGLFGDNIGTGNDAINHYVDNYIFRRNLLINRPIDRTYSYWITHFSSSYPPDNLMVHNISEVGFMDYNNQNYRLLSISPGKNNGTDGKDIGPNYDTIDEATRCTLDGQCYMQCFPNCSGKACGNDGCSGSCGVCNNGESCIDYNCEINSSNSDKIWFFDSFEGMLPKAWNSSIWGEAWDNDSVINVNSEIDSLGNSIGAALSGGNQSYRQWWNGQNDIGSWSTAGGLYSDFSRITQMPDKLGENDTFYLSYHIKYDPQFFWGDTTGLKQIIIQSNSRVDDRLYIGLGGWGAGYVEPFFQVADGNPRHLYSNINNINGTPYIMPLGIWVNFEWFVKISNETNKKGILYGWVNNELLWNYTDIATIESGEYVQMMINPTFNPPTYGERDDNLSEVPQNFTQRRYWDNFYFGSQRRVG